MAAASRDRLVSRAVYREVARLLLAIERRRQLESASIERAVHSGVCRRNATSDEAIRAEQLLSTHGGDPALALRAAHSPCTVEGGFAAIRQLSAHVDALDHFVTTAAFVPRRREPRAQHVQFRVGDLVRHRHFHLESERGSGVIYGWEPSLNAEVGRSEEYAGFVDNRRRFSPIDAGRQDEPHYRVLTRGGEARCVAQSLLEPFDTTRRAEGKQGTVVRRGARRPPLIQGASFFFTRARPAADSYEPKQWLRELYPDDWDAD